MRVSAIAAIVVCAANTTLVSAGAEKARKVEASKAVTVTGCLEQGDTAFRLTETAGAQAPKSRSWKSGFMKKRAADLSVVDPSRRMKLRDHVGHRDALTGTIDGNELRVQSMRHLAPSCGH